MIIISETNVYTHVEAVCVRAQRSRLSATNQLTTTRKIYKYDKPSHVPAVGFVLKLATGNLSSREVVGMQPRKLL